MNTEKLHDIDTAIALLREAGEIAMHNATGSNDPSLERGKWWIFCADRAAADMEQWRLDARSER